jgi:hypothetical protein
MKERKKGRKEERRKERKNERKKERKIRINVVGVEFNILQMQRMQVPTLLH